MKRYFFIAFLSILTVFLRLPAQEIHQDFLVNSHDILSLDKWGPYSKQYSGISHIEDVSSGRRVDFTVVPGYYRRSCIVPNVLYESACYPWSVSSDMRSICYRYELEWKDRLYVDVTYNVLDAGRVSVAVHCVNNTEIVQNVLLHNLLSLHYAENYPEVELSGTSGLLLKSACDYEYFEPAVKGHDYNLVYDGWYRGEERDSRALGGSVLGKFGKNSGDVVAYVFRSHGKIENPALGIRCMARKGETAEIRLSGMAEGSFSIHGTGEYELFTVACGKMEAGEKLLEIESENAVVLKIDELFYGDQRQFAGLEFNSAPLKYRPRVEKNPKDFILKYPGVNNCYGLAWNYDFGEIKEFANSDLDVFLKKAVHKHPTKYFNGDGHGHFVSGFLRPIVLEAESDTTLYILLATGNEDRVKKSIADYHSSASAFGAIAAECKCGTEKAYLPQGKVFSSLARLLQATLLTNVVYPVYTQGEFIRHFTPGKNWNSLYTWDSGCISLALSEIDTLKAFETIRAYTTEVQAQSAFIHHGTPLPIQFFAFAELNEKLADKEALKWLYPRLKRYYDYMTGKDGTSTTMMPSGLMRTWDYFYNSGGWDDYPPQHELRMTPELYSSVAPAVTTAYYLRAAKIMKMFAEQCGYGKDAAVYGVDIKNMSAAIQKYAWDETSGYYSYVVHDGNGRPCGFYKYSDGTNFNMGMDGVSPLVGGCCTETQASRLIENIFSSDRMWTDYGISTVDRSAPYYDPTGYWNGCVWIPHQYFIWKALLDCNRPALAEKLAFTAMSAWNRECEESYNCMEHFIIASGRGAGWHNFSGLSSPLLNFYNSYFRVGHIANGFDVSVVGHKFNGDFSALEALLRFDGSSVGKSKTVIVCMNPAYDYEVQYDGKVLKPESPYKGLYYISVEAKKNPQKLSLRRGN